MLEEARAFRQEVLLVRQWVRSSEGVYVAEQTPHATDGHAAMRRNKPVIEDKDGEVFYRQNVSQVTKALSRLSQTMGIVTFRGVSMSPVSADDTPDPFEIEGLRRLKDGEEEIAEFAVDEGETEFRYMAPFVTTARCLSCHDDHGYIVGEVNSALSFRIPATRFEEEKRSNMWFMIASGMAVILLVAATILLISRNFMRKLSKADRQLHKMATEDTLTELFNRRMGMNLLERDIARCKRHESSMTLLMLDIDHFKRVNDQYGHASSDRCIRKLADSIRAAQREYDVAFRYGGEEFVVVLTKACASEASGFAERLRSRVEAQTLTAESGEEYRYTISIGVAELECGQSPEALLKNADGALYEAKEAGRNRTVIYKGATECSPAQEVSA